MGTAVYISREEVKASLDSQETARNNAQIDRLIEGASRGIDRLCHRVFFPEVDTRYFDWPNNQYAWPWNLWLDSDEVISVTILTSGGTTIAPTDYFLEPINLGPPFTRISINLASRAAFSVGATYQRDIAVTGLFGYANDERAAGILAVALASTSATSLTCSDSSAIGVGQLIRIDSERLTVTGKGQLDTGQTILADLAASDAGNAVSVTNGTLYTIGELLTVDAERMLIVDIAGNTLVVKRAWDGSILAAHTTGAHVYAPRVLTVVRGELGTTAATHLINAPIVKHQAPGPIRDLCLAEVLTKLTGETSGYSRTETRGANGKPRGLSVSDLRIQVEDGYARKMRQAAI